MGWTAISLWLSFRSIDRIDVDLEAARSNIENMPESERPPPPPLDTVPEDVVDPVGPEPTTPPASTQPPDDGPVPTIGPIPDFEPDPRGDITGDQAPYNPDFDRSPPIPDEAFNAFLIIGSDTRTPGRGGQRADVIILALLPSTGTPPILVSLPRDLWVKIPCWESRNRINASLNGCGSAATGPELLALTVADFTGIQPDHFALFDFEDFRRVIDAFGGIEICVEYPVRENRLELPAGCSEVDGDTALLWVRSRHTQEFRDGRWRTMRGGVNDLTRNDRQRDVLLQLLGKVRSFDSITSLTRRVDSISDAVTIDDGMTLTGAVGLAWDLRRFSPNEIIQVTIPVYGHRTEGGASVLLPRESFAETFAEVWQPAE